MTARTVLLVDPDDGDRRSIEDLVAALGYRVTSVTTPEAAEQAMRADMPDLLLTSHPLPTAAGGDFVEDVTGAFPDLCVVAMIRRGMREVARDLLSHGCADFLSKPVEEELIATKLRDLIGGPG